MRLKLCVVAVVVLLGGAAQGQMGESVRVPLDKDHLTLQDEATLVTYLGQPAVRVHRGAATLKDVDFAMGTIEFDVSFQHEQGFAGIQFRGSEKEAEFFYLRPHQSGFADSNQYLPIMGGEDTWQIYSGPEFESNDNYVFGGWNHVRLEVYATSADVFINGARSLRIPSLKGNGWAWGGLAGGVPGGGECDGANILFERALQEICE